MDIWSASHCCQSRRLDGPRATLDLLGWGLCLINEIECKKFRFLLLVPHIQSHSLFTLFYEYFLAPLKFCKYFVFKFFMSVKRYVVYTQNFFYTLLYLLLCRQLFKIQIQYKNTFMYIMSVFSDLQCLHLVYTSVRPSSLLGMHSDISACISGSCKMR
jgi:hypothetical protein